MFKLASYPIRKKTSVLFMIICVAFTINAGWSYYSTHKMQNNIEHIARSTDILKNVCVELSQISLHIKFNAVQVQQWLTDISATRGQDGLNDGFDMAAEFVGKFAQDVVRAKELAAQSTKKDVLLPLLADIEEAFPPYYETGKKMARAYVEEGPAGGNQMMGDFDEVAERIGTLTDELVEISNNRLHEHEESVHTFLAETTSYANYSSIVSIAVALIALFIAVFGGTYLHRSLTAVAEGLSSRANEVIHSVVAASEQLTNVARHMASIMTGVESRVQNVAKSSSEMAGNVNSVAASGEEMAATSSQIASQVEQSSSIVRSAVEEVNKADETSKELDKASKSIGELIRLIQDIAEQTNLLALNAAIESARAGEAGKGFAVVAGEVKKLASQTAEATNDISAEIQRIQKVSTHVVAALNSIKTAIEGVESNASAISESVREQTIATTDISSSMTIAAGSTSKINEDIGSVETSASEAGESASEVLDAATSLAKEAEKLSAEVSHFLAELR